MTYKRYYIWPILARELVRDTGSKCVKFLLYFILLLSTLPYNIAIADEGDVGAMDAADPMENIIESIELEPKAQGSTSMNKVDELAPDREIAMKTSELQQGGAELPSSKKAKAELVLLNKITAKSELHLLSYGEAKKIGTITIELKSCVRGDDPFKRDHTMLLFIWEEKNKQPKQLLFSGWMLARNPSISTLEHPVYDILPQRCLE